MKTPLQDGLRRAMKANRVIVQPKPNELQLDLDGPEAMRNYAFQFAILSRAGFTSGWKERITKSTRKGHVHATLTLPCAVNDFTRVCLQAILGSDIKREAFNLCRVFRRNRYAIVFFEGRKNGQKAKVKFRRKTASRLEKILWDACTVAPHSRARKGVVS